MVRQVLQIIRGDDMLHLRHASPRLSPHYPPQQTDEKERKEEKTREGYQKVKEKKQPILEPFIDWMIGKSILQLLDFRSVTLVVVKCPQCYKS